MKNLITILFGITLFSCHKESFQGNNGIVGKWKLTEQTSGLGIAGGIWIPISSDYIKQIAFFSDGTFNEFKTTRGEPQQCSGSYQFIGDSLLRVNSSCTINDDTIIVKQLSAMQLQLIYPNEFSRAEKFNATE